MDNRYRIQSVLKGYILMIIACIVYIAWWFVNYYPDSPFSNFIENRTGMGIWVGMFAAVGVLCIAGVVLIVKGFRSLDRDRELLHPMCAAIICIAASVILPLVISRIRFITLDIFLIIWWAFLELSAADYLYGAHLLEEKTAKRSVVRTLAFTAISLFLYIIYHFPPAYVRFWLGAVPIVLYAADMIWMTGKMKQ